jgi:lysophospholipase L1-like esterase
MSIKDTSAFPETGWGMPFVYFWDPSVKVVNKARNGRSTRTFIEEGLWQSVTDSLREGDYVFIQFGHNDEVKEKKSYTTPDSFAANLKRFVSEAQIKKANPVLLSPVARRSFDHTGTPVDTHEAYAGIVKNIAQELNVPFIDLNALSLRLYGQLGDDKSKMLFVQLDRDEHPNYPAGKIDNTHFNELGARVIAQLVLSEIRTKVPGLSDRIIKPNKK